MLKKPVALAQIDSKHETEREFFYENKKDFFWLLECERKQRKGKERETRLFSALSGGQFSCRDATYFLFFEDRLQAD
jgi:hypothetical protein